MSRGNKWPLARYSKANRIKINVEISSSQNASMAMAYEMKNCRSAVNTSETTKTGSVKGLAGGRTYCRKQRINTANGSAATIIKAMRPETNRQRRYHR